MESPQPTGADWLDACCWRCGADQADPGEDDRMLCPACRRELFGPPDARTFDVQVPRQVYWESHALERCWRCMTQPVEPDDDLGLCSSCR